MIERYKRWPSRTAGRWVVSLLVFWTMIGGTRGVAGEAAPAAAPGAAAAESRTLKALERRVAAIERRRKAGPDARSAKMAADPRPAELSRRLEEMACDAGMETGPAERIAALQSRLAAPPKAPSGLISLAPSGSAPANDTCASATVIGNGAFSGDTSSAGTDGDASCGDSDYSPDVWFKYTAPSTGSVYFNTFGSSYDTVLSLHSACPGTSGNEIDCNDDAGSVLSELLLDVTVGEVLYVRVSGYGGNAGMFALNVGPGGSVSGTVTETGSGTPITNGQVIVYRAENGMTDFIDSDLTDGSGAYSVGGLSPGTYRAIARSTPHVNELYDDIPCPGGINSCFPERGAQIAVAGGADTSGVDFALAPGGSISGTVTGSGSPIPGASVGVYDASGNFIFNDLAAVDGSYTVEGLPDGYYFVATRYGTVPYADEVYLDVPCPGGGGSQACPLRNGLPVFVAAPNDTPGVDLDLAEGGSIEGTVSESGSGTPLADVDVEIYDDDGRYLGSATSEADGSYVYEGLHSDSYFAVTYFASPHVDEAWNDVSCFGGAPWGCMAIDGTPIAVTAPSATTGIDFALIEGGSVSGTVTEQGSGTPLANVQVELYSATGEFMDLDTTFSDGSWGIGGLPTASYRVQTFAAAPYADKLYDDISCPGGWCDVTPGTAVPVVAPADTPNIDFALTMGGAISGTVLESGSATPLSWVDVSVFDSAGDYVGGAVSAVDGSYTAGGLPTGSYYVSTTDVPLHVDELYDDLACPGGGGFGCDATTGTSVAVTAPSTVGGVDFALAAGGAISGSVSDAVTLLPLDRDPEVLIYDSAGAFLTAAPVDGAGDYESTGFPSGTYHARVDNSDGFLNRRYDGLSCSGTCDPELGTPVVVAFPAMTPDIDFMLYLPGADPNLVLSKEDLNAEGDFCAQGSITAGPDLGIIDGAIVGFLSDTVSLLSGFSADTGTELLIDDNPTAACD